MSTLSHFVELPPAEQQNRGLAFTPREIAQQPATWGGTFAIFQQNLSRITDFLDRAGVRAQVEERPVVLLVGAGTSDYIGHSLASLLRRSWGCEVFACASTTLLTNLEDHIIPGRRYLFVSFSRSGDSPEGVAVLEQAIRRFPGISQMVVTCNPQAKMISVAQAAEHTCTILLDDAVNDRSLVMTSSFTNMVVLGQCLAHAWSLADYEPILSSLQSAATDLLSSAAVLAQQTAELRPARVCVLGSGPLEGAARECALKVLEMTAGRIQTMSETVLGLRHGPMAALDGSTVLLCLVSGEANKAMYAKDLVAEVGAKKIVERSIVVGLRSREAEFAGSCDAYLALDAEVEDVYRPVLDVIFAQMLGLFCSVSHGLKPDAPSPGGVITRVVQAFRIY